MSVFYGEIISIVTCAFCLIVVWCEFNQRRFTTKALRHKEKKRDEKNYISFAKSFVTLCLGGFNKFATYFLTIQQSNGVGRSATRRVLKIVLFLSCFSP